VAGIAAIKQSGYIVGPMSNGNTSLLLDMAKAAGLPWDLILGSDVSRAYKPDKEAYLRPAALLELEPGEVMLAAAHDADLAAAREAGLATAFIDRPLEHGPDAARTGTAAAGWDLAGASITEIAALLERGRHSGQPSAGVSSP
jgi:2-haloacid dehalogenase